ncbi:hypothetical protein HYU96_00470 [Candidatus Daviesbacteria bacterium]|nr:hypothetical protein [Candidatus Daviesbacteria bacterium]
MEATQSGVIQFFNQVTAPGVIVGFLGSILTLFANHILSRQRDREDREEAFKLKLYELRIQAAQTANQYIFRIYKEQGILEGLKAHLTVHEPEFKKQDDIINDLIQEASNWIDGQVLILGQTINRKFYAYLNGYDSKYEKELREDVQKTLTKLIKKDFIKFGEEDEKPKLYIPDPN